MIDYTQLAFQRAPTVTDPLPSVADYVRDYEAQNRAWYEQWAFPMGGGRYGARPASFEVRAPWTADLLPEETMPEVIRETAPAVLGGESPGMGNTAQEDRPVGMLVRDPAEMTNDELWSAYLDRMVPRSAVYTASQGIGAGLLGTLAGMGARGMLDYDDRVLNEIGRRMGALYPAGGTPGGSWGIPGYTPEAGGTVAAGGITTLTPEEALRRSYTPEPGGPSGGGYSSADRSGSQETVSEPGGIGGV